MSNDRTTFIDMSQNMKLNPQNVTITHSSSTTSVTSELYQPELKVNLALPQEKALTTVNSLPLRTSIIQPSLIIPFSILGLLARLGLVSIESFTGQQVFAQAWPQFIGCLLMGLFVSTRLWIDQGFVWSNTTSGKTGHWIGPFIYVALSSGLCGSITTFSSWNLATFVELINTAKVSRHPLQNILSALSELTVTLALSITGLQLGSHLGDAFFLLKPSTSDTNDSSSTVITPTIPKPPARWTLFDFGVILFGVALWTGMIIASIFMPSINQTTWRHTVLACCFAPVGAILRWYLSRYNPKYKAFPIGTFAVNIGGSMILAGIVCMQHSPSVGGKSALACQVLVGLEDGFCGCLTTISTFALELKSLPRKASYIYGLASVIIAQLLMLLILGSYVWTRRSTETDHNVYQNSQCKMYS